MQNFGGGDFQPHFRVSGFSRRLSPGLLGLLYHKAIAGGRGEGHCVGAGRRAGGGFRGMAAAGLSGGLGDGGADSVGDVGDGLRRSVGA